MPWPFSQPPAAPPLSAEDQRRLFASNIERLATVEDHILKLTQAVATLKAEQAAMKLRYEANRAAEVAGHQADIEAVISDVVAMTADVAAMEPMRPGAPVPVPAFPDSAPRDSTIHAAA